MEFKTLTEALRFARTLYEDLSFRYVHHWKQAGPERRVIGYLPIYIPREIVHAAGMLPVGIFGGGDRIQLVRGDAYFQSYICHLPRTVIELALGDHYRDFDGFLFPSICDVIRNLSGVFQITFPDKFVRYLDFPQNFQTEVGGRFYRRELERLARDLEQLNGQHVDSAGLNQAIALYNRNRRLVTALIDFRADYPHRLSAVDCYLLLRAGTVLSVTDHNTLLEQVLKLLETVDAEPEDKIRVVITGAFCEQPPLALIKTIENAGCYIVDDDFQLGLKWIEGDVPADSDDPLGALVEAYLQAGCTSAARFEDNQPRGEALAQAVKRRRADGVLFCAPSFCDPSLLDQPQLEQAMDHHHIRHLSFQYHENLGQFHVIKEQAGTFSDMIKLWE
jgi:benzoyl-CoA reductase subunit C